MFRNRKEQLFSMPEHPVLNDAIEFDSPNEKIVKELRNRLILLSNQNNIPHIEKPLTDKIVVKYASVEEILEVVKKDLEDNFSEYTDEFLGEPFGFIYYLGNHLFFPNAVEIVQKIYHKDKNAVGDLYYSLVIKFIEGRFYYWKW